MQEREYGGYYLDSSGMFTQYVQMEGHLTGLPEDSRIIVYGQIVADDVFGHIYMVPMSDILDDIKKTLNAVVVRLPSSISEVADLLSEQKQRKMTTSPSPELSIDQTTDLVESTVELTSDVDSQQELAMRHKNIDHYTIWDEFFAKPFAAMETSEPRSDVSHKPSHKVEENSMQRGFDRDLSEEEPKVKRPRTNPKIPWTPTEEARFKQMRSAGNSWDQIAKVYPNRTEENMKKH